MTRPLLAALVLMGTGCLTAQQRDEPRQELTGQQLASLRAAIQEVGGRKVTASVSRKTAPFDGAAIDAVGAWLLPDG